MHFCVPRSLDICLKCLMLKDFIHRIIDISAQPSMSISTLRKAMTFFRQFF